MADNSGKRRILWWTVDAVLTIALGGATWAAFKRIPFPSDWFVRLGLLVLALLALAIWKVPQWQVGGVKDLESKERFDRENEARKTLATILGGLVLLLGTWQNLNLARAGRITDRFSKAIEQLGAVDASGKKKLEVRLGGIYALEGIANESEELHWPIMEDLCTYVRVNAPIKRENSPSKEQKPKKPTPANEGSVAPPNPDADIQAILTVLGRRDHTYERGNPVLDLRDTIFAGADLIGANLSYANLGGADLRGADLRGAILRGVDLRGAILSKADLRRAILSGATLSEADVSGAYLSEADLRGAALNRADLHGATLYKANLRGADLTSADLREALVHGADLTGALYLTQEQIDAANGDANTRLPDDLHMPESWKK